MREIVFTVTSCSDTGGYVARWDDAPGRGGITTQGDTLQELQDMVREAVDAYFEGPRPKSVRLHFAEDPVVSLT